MHAPVVAGSLEGSRATRRRRSEAVQRGCFVIRAVTSVTSIYRRVELSLMNDVLSLAILSPCHSRG